MASALMLSACATVPAGPSVLALPGPWTPPDVFQADDAECRQWAARQVGIAPGTAGTRSAVSSAAIGTLIGAGLGAAIGAAAGNPAIGAAIGAGSGLLGGTAVGADAAWASASNAQFRYDNTYQQCMYVKGNQIPIARAPTAGQVSAAAPPPPPPPPPRAPAVKPGSVPPPVTPIPPPPPSPPPR